MEAADTLLRARFERQGLAGRAGRTADPAAVARAVCAVQAQELNAGCLSLRARSSGLTRTRVLAALDQTHTLAWTWLMRGTLHVCAADDLRWLLSLFGPLNAARDARRRAQVGLDDAACARGLGVMRRALSNGPLTRHELREALLAGSVDVTRDPQALIHLIAYAASQGVILVLPPAGRDNRFALLDDCVPHAGARASDVAEAELARRYLAAFAPATVADFRTWAGIPAGMAQRAVAHLADELEQLSTPLGEMLAPRDDPRKRMSGRWDARVRLLPRWDTYLLGYRSRSVMLDPQHTARVCIGGVIKPSICVDGRLEGVWELRRGRAAWRIELQPFAGLSPAVMAAIDAEAEAITTFLGAPVQVDAERHNARTPPA